MSAVQASPENPARARRYLDVSGTHAPVDKELAESGFDYEQFATLAGPLTHPPPISGNGRPVAGSHTSPINLASVSLIATSRDLTIRASGPFIAALELALVTPPTTQASCAGSGRPVPGTTRPHPSPSTISLQKSTTAGERAPGISLGLARALYCPPAAAPITM